MGSAPLLLLLLLLLPPLPCGIPEDVLKGQSGGAGALQGLRHNPTPGGLQEAGRGARPGCRCRCQVLCVVV